MSNTPKQDIGNDTLAEQLQPSSDHEATTTPMQEKTQGKYTWNRSRPS